MASKGDAVTDAQSPLEVHAIDDLSFFHLETMTVTQSNDIELHRMHSSRTAMQLPQVHIDIAGSLPISRDCTYLLTMVDHFNHFPVAVQIQNITAVTIAQSLVDH